MIGTAVEQVMHRDWPTVARDTPLPALAGVLAGNRVRAVVVVDDEDRPVGVVSESDLVRHDAELRPVAAVRADAARVPTAADLMSSPTVAVGPRTSLREAEVIAQSSGVRQLFVLDEAGRLIGAVSRGDLLRDHLRTDAQIREDVATHVLDGMFSLEPGTVGVTVADGVVTLHGQLEPAVLEGDVVRAVYAVPGVLVVDSHLSRPHPLPRPRHAPARIDQH